MKTTEEIRQAIAEQYGEESLENLSMFENPAFVGAIVGFDNHHHKIIYDYDKMVACLMDEDGMTMEEAIEFIDYNTLRTVPYMENPPIIAMPLFEL
jgi:hypothetical protein